MRQLGAKERELWRLVTGDVKPLKHASTSRGCGDDETEYTDMSRSRTMCQLPRPFSINAYKAKKQRERELEALGALENFDGQIRPWHSRKNTRLEGRLDLHGHTAQEAFLRFKDFMQRAAQQNLRCVHVITGIGPRPDGGVLRQELPAWLQHPEVKHLIIKAGYTPYMNKGAMCVTLKKKQR